MKRKLIKDMDNREYLLLNGSWNVRLYIDFFKGKKGAYWYWTLTIHDGHMIQCGGHCELKDDSITDGLKMWDSFRESIAGKETT